jgi:hypothetical protein
VPHGHPAGIVPHGHPAGILAHGHPAGIASCCSGRTSDSFVLLGVHLTGLCVPWAHV